MSVEYGLFSTVGMTGTNHSRQLGIWY